MTYQAFYTCVRDLRHIATLAGTTYEVVNLMIYVLGSIVLMTIDILGGKLMLGYAFLHIKKPIMQ